ncbi:hypothetical protein WICPIJ_001568 [Wickerhamomyces pijperi]|uniref:Uncharacterized protein n=1 Tax=Wickerhamomyces pijperi TaxID=599730 RepID=A0A9P8QAQ4_WICPI|nr:hypothetical protein WICPIJ_001568 [Wickerhamomyces pijperi]
MDYKRDSVASEVSEFSFEQNEEENINTQGMVESTSFPTAAILNQVQSPSLGHTSSTATVTKHTLTYEQLLEENESLKTKVTEQELLISDLRQQLSELDKHTRVTTSARPSVAVPVTPTSSEVSTDSPTITVGPVATSSSSASVKTHQLEVKGEDIPREQAELITVPVRSTQRHRPSPLRGLDKFEASASECDDLSLSEAEDSTLTSGLNADSSVHTQQEEKPSFPEEDALDASARAPLIIDTTEDILGGAFDSDNESSDEDINKSHLSTPVRSIIDSHIDWDSTLAEMEKTNSSPESTYLKSPLSIVARSEKSSLSASSTPLRQPSPSASSSAQYRSGRVSSLNNTPSPSPSPRQAIKQSESLASSTSTVNQNNFTNTEQLKNKPSRLNLGGDSAAHTPTPISPIRYVALANAQHEHQMQRNMNFSSPTTPTNSSQHLTGNNSSSELPGTKDYSVPIAGLGITHAQSQPSLSHSISHSSLASSTYSNGSVRPYTMSTNSPTAHLKKLSSPIPQFPTDVPLFVQPDQLSTIKPVIISTISSANLKKNDEPFITISIHDRTTDKEIWRFKKTHTQFMQLDSQIRPSLLDLFSVPPLPDKTLFQSTVPVKVDQRRSQLTDYILSLFHIRDLPIEVAYRVARFMSQDIVNLLDEVNMDVAKEGWLLRKGKGLKGGTWKARYSQIDGPFMNVYETNPNVLLNSGKAASGAIIDTIRLTGAQIGRQPSNADSEKNGYIHAFAVMELKKGNSGSFNKFVFCAETDYERDEWVQTLLSFADSQGSIVNSGDSESVYSSSKGDTSLVSSQTVLDSPINSEFGAVRYQDVEPSDELDELKEKEREKELKKQKKKSFFPFVKKSAPTEMDNSSTSVIDSYSTDPSFSNIEKSLQSMNLNANQPSQTNRIFQNDNLDQILTLSPNHILSNRQVPSIIHRCIEFLSVNNAMSQEGIFRLSGSAALIKQFREQFDTQYDIDFNLLPTKPDINTVAGLLKLWFRELPSSIIARNVQIELKLITERFGSDPAANSREFRSLITKRLPIVNQSILFVLFEFLHKIVSQSDVNKMNLRNLCIVFSPTLNLQAECLVPLILDYAAVFEGKEVLSLEKRRAIEGTNVSMF